MQLTKYTHACVRLDRDGSALVIDPGTFSERTALAGAGAVLVTHEHADHLDLEALGAALAERPALRVYAHPDVAARLAGLAGAVTEVHAGEEFFAAGFTVRAYGGQHAAVHPEVPRVANLGYLVDGAVYHPGDSFAVPDGASVDVLLIPVSAPWLKLAEAVDFARAVGPRRGYALHDALLNDAGHQLTTRIMSGLAGCEYQRLSPGTSVHV